MTFMEINFAAKNEGIDMQTNKLQHQYTLDCYASVMPAQLLSEHYRNYRGTENFRDDITIGDYRAIISSQRYIAIPLLYSQASPNLAQSAVFALKRTGRTLRLKQLVRIVDDVIVQSTRSTNPQLND